MRISLGLGLGNQARPPVAQALDPLDLFRNGEKGFVLDPSDLDSVFQDIGGTSPGGGGLPVSVVLDARRQKVVAPVQALINGSSIPLDNFTPNGLDFTASTEDAGGMVYQLDRVLGPGNLVLFEAQVTSGDVYVASVLTNSTVGGGTWGSNRVFLDDGYNRYFLFCNRVSGVMYLQVYVGEPVDLIEFSDVQIHYVTGIHAIQQTSGERPILDVTNGSYALVFAPGVANLDTVLPEAIDGQILIAGRTGIFIGNVSYAAGSDFQLGPDTYTDGPAGVLADVGPVVGMLMIDRELTPAEITQLVQFYKGRGAGDLLV